MADGYVPGEILEKTKAQDIQLFLQTQSLATQTGIAAGQGILRAEMFVEQQREFTAEQGRLESTAVLQALIALRGQEISRLSVRKGVGADKAINLNNLVRTLELEQDIQTNLDTAATTSGLSDDPIMGLYYQRIKQALFVNMNISEAKSILAEMGNMPIATTPDGGAVINNVLERTVGPPTIVGNVNTKKYNNAWVGATGIGEGKRYINEAVVNATWKKVSAYNMGSVNIPGTTSLQNRRLFGDFVKNLLMQIEDNAEAVLRENPDDLKAKTIKNTIDRYEVGLGVEKLAARFARTYLGAEETKDIPLVSDILTVLRASGIDFDRKTVRAKGYDVPLGLLQRAIGTRSQAFGFMVQASSDYPAYGGYLETYLRGVAKSQAASLLSEADRVELRMRELAAMPSVEAEVRDALAFELTEQGFDVYFKNGWGTAIRRLEDGGQAPEWEIRKEQVLDYLTKAIEAKDDAKHKKAQDYATQATRIIWQIGRIDLNRLFRDFVIDELDINIPSSEGIRYEIITPGMGGAKR